MKIKLSIEQIKQLINTITYIGIDYLGYSNLDEFFEEVYSIDEFSKLSQTEQIKLMLEEVFSMLDEFCEYHTRYMKIKEVVNKKY